MRGNAVDCHVLGALSRADCPHLAERLEALDVTVPLLATRWFLCLWVSVLPHSSLLRVWDALECPCQVHVNGDDDISTLPGVFYPRH